MSVAPPSPKLPPIPDDLSGFRVYPRTYVGAQKISDRPSFSEGEEYYTHVWEESSPKIYSVIYTPVGAGTAFTIGHREQSHDAGEAHLGGGAGPFSGEVNGGFQLDRSSGAHHQARSTQEVGILSISGGSAGCCGRGTTWVTVHIYVRKPPEQRPPVAPRNGARRTVEDRASSSSNSTVAHSMIQTEQSTPLLLPWVLTTEKLKATAALAEKFLRTRSFGHEEWKTHFAIEVPPHPLPREVVSKLLARCVLWPEYFTWQTHTLVLVPARPTTLATLRSATPDYFRKKQVDFGSAGLDAPRWALVANADLPGSTEKTYQQQLKEIAKYPGYQVAELIEVVSAVLAHRAQTDIRLFEATPKWVRVADKATATSRVLLGSHSQEGLSIPRTDEAAKRTDATSYADTGLAVSYLFERSSS